jgi:hypothetical protein
MKVLINSLKKITHTSKNNIKLNAIGNPERLQNAKGTP